jgi:hypothetical protein
MVAAKWCTKIVQNKLQTTQINEQNNTIGWGYVKCLPSAPAPSYNRGWMGKIKYLSAFEWGMVVGARLVSRTAMLLQQFPLWIKNGLPLKGQSTGHNCGKHWSQHNGLLLGIGASALFYSRTTLRVRHTVHSERIQANWLFPHFVTLQPYSKTYEITFSLSNLHTITHHDRVKTGFQKCIKGIKKQQQKHLIDISI